MWRFTTINWQHCLETMHSGGACEQFGPMTSTVKFNGIFGGSGDAQNPLHTFLVPTNIALVSLINVLHGRWKTKRLMQTFDAAMNRVKSSVFTVA